MNFMDKFLRIKNIEEFDIRRILKIHRSNIKNQKIIIKKINKKKGEESGKQYIVLLEVLNAAKE